MQPRTEPDDNAAAAGVRAATRAAHAGQAVHGAAAAPGAALAEAEVASPGAVRLPEEAATAEAWVAEFVPRPARFLPGRLRRPGEPMPAVAVPARAAAAEARPAAAVPPALADQGSTDTQSSMAEHLFRNTGKPN